MFKKGQILRHRLTKSAVLVIEWPQVMRLTKPIIGQSPIGRVYRVPKGCDHLFALIGNNYQECKTSRETRNLIQNLRRDNKELRRQNKDLRDDIGDMASKLHLANMRALEVMAPDVRKFPGTAFRRWLGGMTSDMLEQRGCRKEDC